MGPRKININPFRRTYNALEIFSLAGEHFFALSVFQRSSSSISLIKHDRYNSFETLLNAINKTESLNLIINTEEIITKALPSGIAQKSQIIEQHFPGLNPEEVFYQYSLSKNKVLLNVCRKPVIENWLKKFSQQGYHIQQCAIGISTLGSLDKYLPQGSISLGNYTLNADASKEILTKNKTIPKTFVTINGLELPVTGLLGFALFLSKWKNDINTSNLRSLNELLLRKYRERKWFQNGRSIVVFGLLILVLINALFFMHYHDKYQTLQVQQRQAQTQFNQTQQLMAEMTKKEALLENLINTSTSKASSIIHNITNELPKEIRLDELVFQPLYKKVTSDNAIEPFKGVLKVKGEYNADRIYNSWLKELEAMENHSQVDIIEIQAMNSNTNRFHIQITLE